MKEKVKIKCINCDKETIVNRDTLGTMERETNYKAVLDMDLNTYWLCERCKGKAKALANELVEMFKGNEYIDLSWIADK